MNFVKQKWFSIKNARKIKSLWDECTPFGQYTDGLEFIECGHKLDNFLDAFLTAKEEISKDKNAKIPLDTNYGDCTEILVNLIQIAEREAEKNSINNNEDYYMLTPELMNKIFLVMNIILEGEKYQQLMKTNPSNLEKILNLLHNLNNEQNKINILAIIRTLGSNPDIKAEIVKIDSFRKILLLLQTNDEKLIKEILFTMKYFLKDETNPDNNLTTTTGNYWMPFQFENLLWKKKVISKFIGQLRLFSKDSIKSELNQKPCKKGLNPLSSKEISEEIEKLTETLEFKKLNKQNYSQHLKEIDEITKNFISSQEMLSSLLNSLKFSDLSTQLEFFEIICNLLFNNLEVQKEFKKIDGYNFFAELIDNICESTSEAKKFEKKIFQIILVVVEDGNKNRRVGNHDAFQFLFQLLNITSKIQPKLQALHTIQELIFQNPLNVVDVMHVNGINILFLILKNTKELMYPPNHDEDNLQLVFAVNDLIDYIAIISIGHNHKIMQTYIDLLSEDISNTVKFIIYHSLVKLTSNIIYYNIQMPSFLSESLVEFLENYIKELKSASNLTGKQMIENMFEMDDDSDNFDESSNSLSSHHSNELSENVNKADLMSEPWIDQILLILELVGLHIYHFPNYIEKFNVELLVSLVCNKLPIEVVELSLWLMQQIILKISQEDSRNEEIPHLTRLIDLIDNPYLSEITKERVCYAIAELLYSANTISLKRSFQYAGGLNRLLEALEDNENSSLSYALFFAFGEAVRSCEENRVYVAQKISIPKLLSIIKSSSLILDLILFQLLFEIVTTQSSYYFEPLISLRISTDNTDENENIKNQLKRKYSCPMSHSSRVSSIIMNISTPQTFDRSTNPVMRQLKSGLSPNDTLTSSSTSSESNSSFLNITEGDFTSSDDNNSTSSRMTGSVGTASSSANLLRFPLSKTSSVDNLLDVDNEGYEDEGELLAISASISKEFAHLTFRNNDSVVALMELLPKTSISTHLSVLFILSNLLQGNPNNEKIFSAVKTINDIINLATQASNHRIRSAYFQLASIIGRYNMNSSSAISLFELSIDKKFETFQLDILQLIYNIVTRKSPDSYFYLDGYSGMFQISMLDRFPSAKNGYTFSCWIKIQSFLYDEVGLFSWQNQSQHTIFELYFKKFIVDNSVKYYLSVQTQNHPMPLEDLSFDSISFYEMTDSWHHIAITHVQQDITLYIDGELIQRCSSFNYPRTVSKDRALTGKIGCRTYGKPNPTQGYFSGKLGAIHFVQSVLEDSVIQRIFISGSLQDISLVKVGAKNKEFLIIDPLSFEAYHPVSSDDDDALILSSSGAEDGYDEFPICTSPSNSPEYNVIRNRTGYKVGNPVGGMYFFHTLSLISIAVEIKAMERCFYFISRSGELQLIALKILTLLIQKNNDNMREFKEKLNGFSVLYYLLVRSHQRNTPIHLLETSNCFDIFEILFDMLSDGQIIHPQKRFIFTHKECFLLILDYLLFCNHQYRNAARSKVLTYFQGTYNNYFKEVVQKKIHRTFYDNIVFYSSNIDFIINNIGLFPIIEYLQYLVSSSIQETSPLIQLIGVIISTRCTTNDAVILFNYICSNPLTLPDHLPIHPSSSPNGDDEKMYPNGKIEEESNQESKEEERKLNAQKENFQREVKIQLLHLLCTALSTRTALIEAFRNYRYCFILLQSANEGYRMYGIRMLGILSSGISSINKTKNTKLFSMPYIIASLSSFPLSIVTYNHLIDLMIGEYKFLGDSNNSLRSQKTLHNSSSNSISNMINEKLGVSSDGDGHKRHKSGGSIFTPVTNIPNNAVIRYPEVIHLILSLLSLPLPLPNVTLKFLSQLDHLISHDHAISNMDLLWNYPWLEWVQHFSLSFLDDSDSPVGANKEILLLISKIVQKMMIFEISRESMRFMLLKEMNEHPSFQLFILETIIDSFDMNPCLDDKEDGCLIINNLTVLYRDVENIKNSGHVCMKILNDINLLAYQNTAEIRTRMKESGIFDIRDHLILHFLRGTFDLPITSQFISTFSFHSIANQAKFRENYGILYLIRFLVNPISPVSQIPYLQIHYILKTVLSPIGENMSIICHVLSDDEVCQRFYAPQIDGASFLQWFLHENQLVKRETIANRIQEIISPLEVNILQHAEKVEVFQEWKRKERLEKIFQEKNATKTMIHEVQEQVAEFLSEIQQSHQSLLNQSYNERVERYISGLNHWKDFQNNFDHVDNK